MPLEAVFHGGLERCVQCAEGGGWSAEWAREVCETGKGAGKEKGMGSEGIK